MRHKINISTLRRCSASFCPESSAESLFQPRKRNSGGCRFVCIFLRFLQFDLHLDFSAGRAREEAPCSGAWRDPANFHSRIHTENSKPVLNRPVGSSWNPRKDLVGTCSSRHVHSHGKAFTAEFRTMSGEFVGTAANDPAAKLDCRAVSRLETNRDREQYRVQTCCS